MQPANHRDCHTRTDLRLVVAACSCQSAAEPRYRVLAGKKGMVECQGQGDIEAAVDIVVALSRTLLRLPRKLGGLRRLPNRPSGHGLGRMCQIILLSGLCCLRLRRMGIWGR